MVEAQPDTKQPVGMALWHAHASSQQRCTGPDRTGLLNSGPESEDRTGSGARTGPDRTGYRSYDGPGDQGDPGPGKKNSIIFKNAPQSEFSRFEHLWRDEIDALSPNSRLPRPETKRNYPNKIVKAPFGAFRHICISG